MKNIFIGTSLLLMLAACPGAEEVSSTTLSDFDQGGFGGDMGGGGLGGAGGDLGGFGGLGMGGEGGTGLSCEDLCYVEYSKCKESCQSLSSEQCDDDDGGLWHCYGDCKKEKMTCKEECSCDD